MFVCTAVVSTTDAAVYSVALCPCQYDSISGAGVVQRSDKVSIGILTKRGVEVSGERE